MPNFHTRNTAKVMNTMPPMTPPATAGAGDWWLAKAFGSTEPESSVLVHP
jgi:hypothetical protein